mmetsp:Transcript_27774/g.66151  ORF Transcript_27774/g.66151 Transcript_27774/m.66151 type:complete len:237 (-) Transcript_27774:310-1020(-)
MSSLLCVSSRSVCVHRYCSTCALFDSKSALSSLSAPLSASIFFLAAFADAVPVVTTASESAPARITAMLVSDCCTMTAVSAWTCRASPISVAVLSAWAETILSMMASSKLSLSLMLRSCTSSTSMLIEAMEALSAVWMAVLMLVRFVKNSSVSNLTVVSLIAFVALLITVGMKVVRYSLYRLTTFITCLVLSRKKNEISITIACPSLLPAVSEPLCPSGVPVSCLSANSTVRSLVG